jgi:hypothetical protein
MIVDGSSTLKSVKDMMKEHWITDHFWEDKRFIGGFDKHAYDEAVDRLFYRKDMESLAFPELEIPKDDEDWDGCYAYFVIEIEYEDYESSEVVLTVEDYIVEASLDWVRHGGEWYLADSNHFSCFLRGMEDPEHRMWILPQGLKEKARKEIDSREDEFKDELLKSTEENETLEDGQSVLCQDMIKHLTW